MIFDIWTILNPFLRTATYCFVLITIGSILFYFHFCKFFNHEVNVYCNNLIKKNAILGLFTSLVVFFSIAGNLSGDLFGIIDISLIKLSFETLSGKSAIFLIFGFLLINISFSFEKNISSIIKSFGIFFILISFVIVGHSTLLGILTQTLVIIHLFCISFWLGSFFPLRYMCINKNFKNLILVSEKFGFYAIFYIVFLIVAGLIFSYILVGGIRELISTTYGNILLIKLIFVSIILTLGALNKFKLVPLIKVDYEQGTKKLKNSIRIEILISFIILFFTSILTTSLPTPMGA